jgi:hypothetical protein
MGRGVGYLSGRSAYYGGRVLEQHEVRFVHFG